jgi:hypothetical protein
MRRIASFVGALVLLLACFYVVWPGWALHRIAEAIREEDAAALERAVDFPRVRASMRGPLTEEVTRRYDQFQSTGGYRGVFAAQLKSEVLPRLVESTLDAVATPANVIFMARNRVALKDVMQRALEQRIILGGSSFPSATPQALGGPAGQPASGVAPRRLGEGPRYTLSNIKGISLINPLEFEVGINRDAAAADPELLLRMAFTGVSWRVIGLAPRRL